MKRAAMLVILILVPLLYFLGFIRIPHYKQDVIKNGYIFKSTLKSPYDKNRIHDIFYMEMAINEKHEAMGKKVECIKNPNDFIPYIKNIYPDSQLTNPAEFNEALKDVKVIDKGKYFQVSFNGGISDYAQQTTDSGRVAFLSEYRKDGSNFNYSFLNCNTFEQMVPPVYDIKEDLSIGRAKKGLNKSEVEELFWFLKEIKVLEKAGQNCGYHQKTLNFTEDTNKVSIINDGVEVCYGDYMPPNDYYSYFKHTYTYNKNTGDLFFNGETNFE